MPLTLCEYNVENLFLSLEYYEGQDLEQVTEEEWQSFALPQLREKQKPLAKVWGVAQAILEIDPDILMLVEVGGRDSLEHFNERFLGGRYHAHFVEGNSRRGIDLAYLWRKELPFRTEVRSHRDTPVEIGTLRGTLSSRFSRDVAELRLEDASGLRLILLLVHLKSMISTEQDFKGKDTRTAEAIALAGIYRELRQAHPEVPIVVGGDFNSTLGSLELEAIRLTDLRDFQDLLGTPREERTTLFHFDFVGNPHPLVLDYLLVSPELTSRVVAEGAGVFRYRVSGIPEPLPRSPSERYRLPSDHYPLVLRLDF